MGSQSRQTSNQTQTSRPDAFTDQWMQDLFSRGQGFMAQPTPNYQVASMSPETQSGLQGMAGYAQGGVPQLDQAYSANARQMSGWNPAMPFAGAVAGGALSNNPWQGALAGYGNGQNPHLQGLFDYGADQITNRVNANMAQSGRYGANAAHSGALTRELGGLYSSIFAPAYESERNRGLQAAQAGGSLWDAGANRMLAGGAMLGDLYNTGQDQAQRGINNIPGLFASGAMPFELMSQVGGAYDAQNQAELDAQYQNQNAPWQRYLEYAAAMQGMPIFGTNVSSGTTRTRGNSVGWSWNNGLSFGG